MLVTREGHLYTWGSPEDGKLGLGKDVGASGSLVWKPARIEFLVDDGEKIIKVQRLRRVSLQGSL